MSLSDSPPAILRGPLTLEGKRKAVDDATATISEAFRKNRTLRPWSSITDGLDEDEVRTQGLVLAEQSEDTKNDVVNLLEGDLGIESHIRFYKAAGLETFIGPRLDIHHNWVDDEEDHPPTLTKILVLLGIRTPVQIDQYVEEVWKNPWNPSQHKGLDSPLGGTIFADEQELATFWNYTNNIGFLRRVLSLQPTDTSGVIMPMARLSKVELQHHFIFRDITRVHLIYFPDETIEKLDQVYSGFKMPALNLIPNRRSFIRSLLRNDIYSGEIHQRLAHIPVLRELGFAGGQEEFDQKTEEVKNLQGNFDRYESAS